MKLMKRLLPALLALAMLAALAGCSNGPVYAEYSPGDYFVTNTKVDAKGKSSMIKITTVLVMNESVSEDAMKEQQARIRDVIVFILRSYTAEEYLKDDIKTTLSTAMVAALNDRLQVNYITDVLFTDFVVQ